MKQQEPALKALLEFHLNKSQISVKIGMLPKSINSQWLRAKSGQVYLDPQAKLFREVFDLTARAQLGSIFHSFQANELLAIVAVIESPEFVTQKNTVAQRDLDNYVKCLIDAAAKTFKFRDENVWEIHLFKQLTAKREQTTLHIIKLGTKIERCTET